MCSILFDAYCVLTLAIEGQGYFFYSLYVFKKNMAKIRILPGRRCVFTILKVRQCRNKEGNSETGYRKIPYICNMANVEKNLSVETLRGIAILLVVVGHVIGSGPDGGMKIDFPHPLRYFYVWIDYIQMPLFTAIAGWVYALKPFSASSGFGSFVRKKALRLLVPMAAVGTLYFLVQYLMPGTNNKGELSQLWRIYIFPYTIYWYLPSLFLIFVVQWWIDSRKWMDTLGKWSICCVVALVFSRINDVWILHEVPDLFSFKGALGQLPYFFVGVASCRFAVSLCSRPAVRRVLLAVALWGIVLIQIVWFYPGKYASLSMLLYPVTLIPTLFLLLASKWHNRFFVWIGGYAYSIYLFHGFGTSGGRIILKMMGIDAIVPILLSATFIATIGPVLVDKLFNCSKMLRMLFLGRR